MSRLVELDGRDRARLGSSVFSALSHSDAVVVLRDVPEILELGATVGSLVRELGGAGHAEEAAALLQAGRTPSLEALATFFRAFSLLRDSRYVSCLFADLVGSLGLPTPILVDSAYCRMTVPSVLDKVHAQRERFGTEIFHPNEAEPMFQPAAWGNQHRDVDVIHYHFQCNFWFPLHPVGHDQTLLVFPEAYRRDVPQYVLKPDADPRKPDEWGFGPALQVPLRLGDTLLFHSQQLHASPSQALERDRFTVELRMAAGCIDDNSRVYRRVFWGLQNFTPSDDRRPATERAAQLVDLRDTPTVEHALEGATPHAVFRRLFRSASASFAAAYVRRPEAVFDNALILSDEDCAHVAERLVRLGAAEDLLLATARLLLRQGHRDRAKRLLAQICARTRSYFWALEVGRVAADGGLYDIAVTAFGAAEIRATTVDFAVGRYSKGMPPPRHPKLILQLLPTIARRAAVAFRRRAELERQQPSRTTLTFDHQFFWPPTIVASYRNYDIYNTGGLIVAVPVNRAFHPERLLDDPTAVFMADEHGQQALRDTLSDKLGEPLPGVRPDIGPVFEVGNFVIRQLFNGWYVVPRECSFAGFLERNILEFRGTYLIEAAMTAPSLPSDLLAELSAKHAGLLRTLTERVSTSSAA